ncbi:KGG domain-containing protein, partial [Bacillus subtilis]
KEFYQEIGSKGGNARNND